MISGFKVIKLRLCLIILILPSSSLVVMGQESVKTNENSKDKVEKLTIDQRNKLAQQQARDYTTDYVSLTVPQPYLGTFYYINDSLKQEERAVNEVIHDRKLLTSFPNTVSNVTVYEVSKDGKLQLFGGGISAKNGLYVVIYDFSQSQTINFPNDSISDIQSVLIGVGVRMVAKVKTKKAGINLNSPFGLTANIEKVKGSLEVRVSGISSQKINSLIPTTSDLSPTSISLALQSIASVKSHMYDPETVITPLYLAYYKEKEENYIQPIIYKRSLIGGRSKFKRTRFKRNVF